MNFVKVKEPNFSNYYINKQGQVAKIKDGKIRLLNDRPSAYGYRRVSVVNDDGMRKDRLVHVWLMKTFIPNPENKSQINHIDGDKSNYDLDNLEWCTPSENIKHMHNILKKDTRIEPCDLYYMGEYVHSFDKIIDACNYAKENYKASYTSLQKYFTSNSCAIIKKSATTIRKE
jgi:hypothetical protein